MSWFAHLNTQYPTNPRCSPCPSLAYVTTSSSVNFWRKKKLTPTLKTLCKVFICLINTNKRAFSFVHYIHNFQIFKGNSLQLKLPNKKTSFFLLVITLLAVFVCLWFPQLLPGYIQRKWANTKGIFAHMVGFHFWASWSLLCRVGRKHSLAILHLFLQCTESFNKSKTKNTFYIRKLSGIYAL